MMRFFLVTLLMLIGFSSEAFACSVCFGDPNSPMIKGLAWGVWVLMGFIGGVLALFTVFFISLHRRMKNLSVSQ